MTASRSSQQTARSPNRRHLVTTRHSLFVKTLQYGLTCRFSKVWRGYPGNLWPWKPQNSEISVEFEGSEAGIMKFQWKMKVLGDLAGCRRECPQGATTARPGSKVLENVRFGVLGALPRPLAGLSSRTLPAWSWDRSCAWSRTWSLFQVQGPDPGPGPKLCLRKIMEFDEKCVYMARYGLISRLAGALWFTIISKTP